VLLAIGCKPLDLAVHTRVYDSVYEAGTPSFWEWGGSNNAIQNLAFAQISTAEI
jgi:hypothetical protein